MASQQSPLILPDHSAGRFGKLSDWLRSHVVLASIMILMCSVAPRLFLTVAAEPEALLRPDSYSYLHPALNLLRDGAFVDSSRKPEVTRTPGYPLFLAGIMTVVGEDLRRMVLLQTVLLSSSVLFLYWFARRVLPSVTAFTGALIAAFSPWGAVLAGVLLTEGLFLWLLILVFLFMKLVQDARNVALAVSGSALVGLLTAATVLVRPAWPLVVLVGLALFIQYGPRRKGVLLVLITTVVCATTPLYLWKGRNVQEAGFHGISDISGRGAWWSLASRVTAHLDGKDRFEIEHAAVREDRTWTLSASEADQERWRRAKEVFQKHPVLTMVSFAQSAAEHSLHPSPDVLTSARLNFTGDFWALAVLWAGHIVLAWIGWRHAPDGGVDAGPFDRSWLLVLLVICSVLTLSSGLSFGQGARYRAPLELVMPLLAGAGLVRILSIGSQSRNPSPQLTASLKGRPASGWVSPIRRSPPSPHCRSPRES